MAALMRSEWPCPCRRHERAEDLCRAVAQIESVLGDLEQRAAVASAAFRPGTLRLRFHDVTAEACRAGGSVYSTLIVALVEVSEHELRHSGVGVRRTRGCPKRNVRRGLDTPFF